MERGPFSPDRPDPERPQGPETPQGPGPQAPTPGPQAPTPGPQAPAPGPQAPPPPPQGPPGYAPPAPERAPGYGGPVPPGGWQQPIARPESGWAAQPLASWGIRLAATVIDWLILVIPAAILGALILGSAFDDDSSAWAVIGTSILYSLLWAVMVLLYAPLLMMRQGERNGQTLGKQLVGIRVVRDSGEPMGFGWAALREVVVKNLLVAIASSILFLIPWFLNYFWPLWDDQNRALHDMVVSTHVIKA
jgi:uncharacterized RDD family membrane protein YckC